MHFQLLSWMSVVGVVSMLFAQPASAILVTAHSDVFAVRDITINNMSSTQSANVTFTFSGQVTALASMTDGASASVSSFVQFDRVDVPELLLSNSISAPPSHTGIFAPQSFNFDIAPGGSVILTSVGSIAADLMITSLGASAMALGTGVDNEEFTNNSPLASITILQKKNKTSSQYELSLQGVDEALFTAVASFSVPGFKDALTVDGLQVVPLETSFTAMLGPGQSVTSLHTSTSEVRVSAIPEPLTLMLLVIGVASLVGYREVAEARS